jgi:mannose-6-phosphate isomerase-like protein (cupin superfamily)
MAINFFDLLGKNRQEMPYEEKPQDSKEALANLVEEISLRKYPERREVEEAVRKLELNHGEFGTLANAKGRQVLASNPVVECALSAWQPKADVFGLVPAHGFEVVRVLKGRMTMTEHVPVRGRMEAYCIAELSQGSVVGMPSGVVYRIENRKKEEAVTLHIVCPPVRMAPASEGIRRLYARGGLAALG